MIKIKHSLLLLTLCFYSAFASATCDLFFNGTLVIWESDPNYLVFKEHCEIAGGTHFQNGYCSSAVWSYVNSETLEVSASLISASDAQTQCLAAPDCTPGTPVDFSLPKDTFPSMCMDGGQCRTTNVDGCLVSYGEPVNCYLDGEYAYCNYNGTAQGDSDPLTPDNSSPFNIGLTPDDLPTENNCIDTGTAVICGDSIPNPDNPNEQCGTMNGELFCMPEDPTTPDGCGTIGGQLVCADSPDNCGSVNGQVICFQPENPDDALPNNTVPDGCIVQGGRTICVNDDVVNDRNSITTTNPDGSTTTITTNDNNISGGGTTTTTTTVSADGNTSSTVTTTTGDGGLSTTPNDEPPEEPERTFSGLDCPASIACSGDPINCGIAQEIHQQRCADQDMADQIFGQDKQPDKSTVQQLIMDGDTYDGTPSEFNLGLLNTGRFSIGGSCPAPRSYDVMGANFTIDLSGFCTLASMIGVFVSIGSSLLALRMIAN